MTLPVGLFLHLKTPDAAGRWLRCNCRVFADIRFQDFGYGDHLVAGSRMTLTVLGKLILGDVAIAQITNAQNDRKFLLFSVIYADQSHDRSTFAIMSFGVVPDECHGIELQQAGEITHYLPAVLAEQIPEAYEGFR